MKSSKRYAFILPKIVIPALLLILLPFDCRSAAEDNAKVSGIAEVN